MAKQQPYAHGRNIRNFHGMELRLHRFYATLYMITTQSLQI